MFENRVFGRRIPQENKQPQELADFEPEKSEKELKKEKMYSTSSKFIFREINLFVPETIGLGVAAMGCIFCLAIGYLLDMQILLLAAGALPLAVMVIFYLVRLKLFMPGKHRHLTIRGIGSNAIRISVDDYKTREVPFDKKPLAEKIKITNLMKNIDFLTGKPIIALKEGTGENITLFKDEPISQEAADFNNLALSIANTQHAWDVYNLEKKGLSNKDILLFLMIAGSIAASLITLYMINQNTGAMQELGKVLSSQMTSIMQAIGGGGASGAGSGANMVVIR